MQLLMDIANVETDCVPLRQNLSAITPIFGRAEPPISEANPSLVLRRLAVATVLFVRSA